MEQKGAIFIPLIIVVVVAVFSTAAYVVVSDEVEAPDLLKKSLSPLLIKKTEMLGEPGGLQIRQAGKPAEEGEVEVPFPSVPEWGWNIFKNIYSPGYFQKIETPSRGAGETFNFSHTQGEEEKCFRKITKEDLEKLGSHCSSIAGYYFGPAIVGQPDSQYNCNPVPGCGYQPEIVPFATKEECESICLKLMEE